MIQKSDEQLSQNLLSFPDSSYISGVLWKIKSIIPKNSGSYRREKTEKPKPDQYKNEKDFF